MTPAVDPEPIVPRYDHTSLGAVLPGVAKVLGVKTGHPAVPLPDAPRVCVVIVDGLGQRLLEDDAQCAPFLSSLLPDGRTLTAGCPSTTATSMGSFGTGTPPGAHGLVGYEVLDPDRDLVFNELSWENGPDPFRWQPTSTVFQEVLLDGVEVTRIGPGFFDGSGLTNAALRGGRFRAASSMADRVSAAVDAVKASPRALVYLYWGEMDKVGHVHGPASWEWVDELESVDRHLSSLAARVPAGTAIHVTADHGMVDVPFGHRVDLAGERDLLAGVRHVAGEPRATQLYLSPGTSPVEVVQRWQDRLADRAWVGTRDEMVDAGWFGAVRPDVRDRIGDVLAVMLDDGAVVDTARMRPELVRLRGLHGSVTDEERGIPFVTVPARTA